MKITVLIDNLETETLACEWGLSLLVETGSTAPDSTAPASADGTSADSTANGGSVTRILLDTGATGEFARNAKKLGIGLGDIDFGVLSHAHFDHADGLAEFFANNKKAPFYLREGSGEDCFIGKGIGAKYIGIHGGFLTDFADRIKYVSGDYQVAPGIWLVPHKMEKAAAIACGKAANMYRCTCGCGRHIAGEFLDSDDGMAWEVDTFDHEQSLVLDSPKGLVIVNGCCHSGADQVIREVAETFPDKKIYTLIGGFHLFRSDDDEINALIKRVDDTGIQIVYTGHCTGEHAMEMFKEAMGDKAVEIYSGLEIEI